MNSMDQTILLLHDCKTSDSNDNCSQQDSSEQELQQQQIASLDKKNVVRNLVRAFLKYMFKKQAQKTSVLKQYFPHNNEYDAKLQVKRYFTKKKYNNLVIKQLFKHPIYGIIFKEFLTNESLNYLENSSVKAKDNHYIFILYLLKCYDDETLLDSLETYSKIKKI